MKLLKEILGYLLGGVLFVGLMLMQVISGERRLRRDFGEEYDACRRYTRRF